MEVAILLRESAVAKSTPGAMGNRETRSGEFCRGMTLFMSYFSRSTRTVYGVSLDIENYCTLRLFVSV
ncbi:hypothetical protein, partial [Escherichia coli]